MRVLLRARENRFWRRVAWVCAIFEGYPTLPKVRKVFKEDILGLDFEVGPRDRVFCVGDVCQVRQLLSSYRSMSWPGCSPAKYCH